MNVKVIIQELLIYHSSFIVFAIMRPYILSHLPVSSTSLLHKHLIYVE